MIPADDDERRHRFRQPMSRRRRLMLVFGPIVLVAGVLVASLGVPWKVVAAILALFVVWILLEG